MEIRELRSGDEAALVELFEAVHPGFSTVLDPDGTAPAVFLADPAAFLLGAYVDGAPAGLAWGLQMRYPHGRLASYLHELEVLEPMRRRGAGRALVTEAMAVARRMGSTKLWLSTGGHNEVAQALYDSLGGDRKPQGDVNYWWSLE